MSYWENFSAGKMDEAFALVADTATWTIIGTQKFMFAGIKSKAQFREIANGVTALMPKGLSMTPKEITAEGDRVAVEVESYGETVAGKVYNNHYHFLFEVQGGKIQAVREYHDTMCSQDFFSPQ